MNTKDERGFILVSGVSLLIVGQAVANMAMVCGLLPVIGVPLSFISYGGTSMLITLASIGLVLSVYRDECKRESWSGCRPIHAGRRCMSFHPLRGGGSADEEVFAAKR